MNKTKNISYNLSFGLNCLLLFLVLFGNTLAIPTWLQVMGRMHPLLLHFPIVLLILAAVWELFLSKKMSNTEGGINNDIGDWLLLSASVTAAISALMGLFLSQESGYNTDAIAWHKWTGVAVSFISILWYVFRNSVRQSKVLSLVTSAASLVAITLVGHQGANITHGEDFLTAPFQPKNEEKQVSFEDAVVFTDLVKPILEKKCIGCHNSKKAKGDLIMETEEQILRGGKNGKLWDVNAPDLGLMMQRIHLPLEDKKHMAPSGKPQLTQDEIAILTYWIKSGADFKNKVNALAPTDSLKILAQSILKSDETEVYNFKAADEGTIKKLNNNYRIITPLALNSPALSVEFFGVSQFKNEQIKELEALKEQIVSLNLNKMPVKDEDLTVIGGFTNLRKLNLSFTQITGATLNELKNLKNLRQLSLSGTGAKMSNLAVLKEWTALKELKLWNTAVNENELVNLRSLLPNTLIESGYRGDTVVAKLSMPILQNEDVQVFQKDTKVELKHFVKGAVIHYTLDGTAPDSLNSPIYTEGGILIDKTCVLKAKAFLEGWLASDTLTQQFYKAGYIADSVRLAQAPNPQYSGKGKMLFDGKLGDSNFKSGKWLGFKETSFEAFLYFNKPTTISKVTLSTLILVGSYIMPAQEVQVWGGSQIGNLTLLKTLRPTQPTQIEPFMVRGLECSFNPKEVSILKLVGKPVAKLPVWHPGKGEKAWFFIDEVFLN